MIQLAEIVQIEAADPELKPNKCPEHAQPGENPGDGEDETIADDAVRQRGIVEHLGGIAGPVQHPVERSVASRQFD